MIGYHFRLAFKSLRRTPAVAALMIGAIAFAVGVCATTLTVYRLMSENPISHRNDVLYAVTLDNWSVNEPADPNRPELPPMEVTWRDALALLESDIPVHRAAMHKASFVLDRQSGQGMQPFLAEGRVTGGDFFAMFDVPFLYGQAWDRRSDLDASFVVVLSKQTNERVFGGEDSVGRTLRLDGRDYRVIGVLDDWTPAPKFYDLNNGAFLPAEDLYVPLGLSSALELTTSGNTNCWRDETIDSFQQFLGSDCVWLQFWAELPTVSHRERFQSFIDNYVREQKKLGRFERPLNNRLRRPDEWLELNGVVRADNRVLVGLSFMFLGVCMLNMIGLLLAKFFGNAAAAGLRRALGASRGMIFRHYLVEVAVIGFAGGVLGLLLAALGLLGLRRLYENYDQLTRLDLPMLGATLAIAVFSGVLAGLYPAWRACRMPPAVHLKMQ